MSKDYKKDVQKGYDLKPQKNIYERKGSEIISLKCYNNWVKACLIQKYTPRSARVLDFCGGKGGDLIKFDKNGVSSVLLCDISGDSLKDAEVRFNERDPPFKFTLQTIQGDCFDPKFVEKFPVQSSFELVSCQFAIHYSFSSEQNAKQAIENVTKHLRKGGMFIGTTVNAYRVVKKLRTVAGNSFGNELFSIKFPEQFDKEHIPTFGAQYHFELKDAIDNLPEYLIPFCEFQKICEDFGLKLIGVWDLHQFHQEWSRDRQYQHLFNVMMGDRGMPQNQWEIIGYYCAFVFQKIK